MIKLGKDQEIGIDLVEIDRFRKKNFSENQSFYEKIFTKSEISYCKKFIDPYPHFAGKFALKEAAQKSINENFIFNKIETYHINSKPKIKIVNQGKKYEFFASISHENKYAIAIAISKQN